MVLAPLLFIYSTSTDAFSTKGTVTVTVATTGVVCSTETVTAPSADAVNLAGFSDEVSVPYAMLLSS